MQIDTIGNIKFDKKTINYLAVLKPAATAILLSPFKTSLKDIIRYTLMDLELKRVLSITHKNMKLHPNDVHVRRRDSLEIGENFTTYRKSEYENYFLSFLNEESYYHLHSYLYKVYADTPMDSRMKRNILKEHKILNLFSTAFSFNMLGLFLLNANGRKVRREIKRYFVTIEQHLPQIIENSPEQALQLVSFLKGNFFLLKNISVETLEKLNQRIRLHKKEIKDEYFDLFDIFEFSDVFFHDISTEISWLLRNIERTYNRKQGSSNNGDTSADFF
ncbi:MAG: hypothetical protein AAF617_01195 [Bacteroidota bacterium]